MASTFTDLGIELMATGENAGTWGTKTNANLNLIEQLAGGFLSVAIAGSGTTALTVAEGALTGTAQNRVIEFTGALTGSRIITFPLLTENFYIIKNSTTNAQTLQLKAASGSGATVTFSTTEKGYKIIYLDGVATNTGVYDITSDLNIDDLTINNLIVKESLDVNGTIKLDGNYPTGTDNVALGDTALDSGSLSGGCNVAIGKASMTTNTSGTKNVAIGRQSMNNNTTGGSNVALGDQALFSNISASGNTAVGKDALGVNTTGDNNTAVGITSLQANTTGTNNVAVGRCALYSNTTAADNTAVGVSALLSNTTGCRNTAVGQQALKSNTEGDANVALGFHALCSNTTAENLMLH